MCQSNYLEISRAALRRNAAAVREAVQVPVIGILKCNGYGVTIHEAAAAWQAAGVCMFGVSRPEEALALRHSGFGEDILLLSPVADVGTLGQMVENNIILTVTDFENAHFYSLNSPCFPVRVHVALDTGMGRFGIRWTDAEQIKAVFSLKGFSFEGTFSHFSRSFEGTFSHTKRQLDRFLRVTEELKAAGYPIGLRHIANSSAALRFPQTRLDAVRVGSALVGRLCAPVPVPLEQVSVFRAQVVACRHFQPGDTTGYGSLCVLKKHTTAAVVALGREDGFGLSAMPDRLRLRDLAAWLYHVLQRWLHPLCVTHQGQKLPLLGRVGNQYTLFDATGVDIRPGDQVEWDGNLMLSSCERRFV